MATVFPVVEHEVDLCVVGGGMSGYATARAAAANSGVRVAILHDRPMLGGNASSEVRMHICGADRHNAIKNMRETGLLEELRLRNVFRNPEGSYGIWDTLLYEDMATHPNITLLLNCSCLDARMEDGQIRSITGWQLQSETLHTVRARWFADCSGDGILAPLSGAEFRSGREGREEYDEANAPAVADSLTMGQTLAFSVRKCSRPVRFVPPAWALKFESCDDLPYGLKGHSHNWFDGKIGYWWVERGGENDTIHENEALRDELLRIVYGIWDHLKNHCPNKGALEYYTIDWIQMLPAKRESRRFVGEYVLTQNDIAACKQFPDNVAYGGWTMDDHDPAGFYANRSGRPSATFNECESGYGIPWRALYSRNVPNLLFAGRNASCTHMAMSSTRVMATCFIMGQALGAGVGLMKERGLGKPSEVLTHIGELQQRLLGDDCYIPGVPMRLSGLTSGATLTASAGDPEPLRDGWARQIKDVTHAWECAPGGWVEYALPSSQLVESVYLALDSGMGQDTALSWYYSPGVRDMPTVLPKSFTIEVKEGGAWRTLVQEEENIRRHYNIPVGQEVEGVRLRIGELWGAAQTTRVYAFCLR